VKKESLVLSIEGRIHTEYRMHFLSVLGEKATEKLERRNLSENTLKLTDMP
jgi:hypothetical protein